MPFFSVVDPVNICRPESETSRFRPDRNPRRTKFDRGAFGMRRSVLCARTFQHERGDPTPPCDLGRLLASRRVSEL